MCFFHRNTQLVQINSLLKPKKSGNKNGIKFLTDMLNRTGLNAEELNLFGAQFIRRGNHNGPRTKQPSDFSVTVCFSTFGRRAVKTVQTQLLTVQMSRQLLKEGRVDCDRNITGAPNQHMNTGEVKEGHFSSSSHHTLQTSAICVFMSSGLLQIKCVLTDLIVISLIWSWLECYGPGRGRKQGLSSKLMSVQAEAICARHKRT